MTPCMTTKTKTDDEQRRKHAKETVQELYAMPYPTMPCDTLKQCFRTPLPQKLQERTDRLEKWSESVKGILKIYTETID